MNLMQLIAATVWVAGSPISFEGRPYLTDILNCRHERVILRAGRQIEKSTIVAAICVLEAITRPGLRILVVMPTREQVKVFRERRLVRILRESPALAKNVLRAGCSVTGTQVTFPNSSVIFLRSAHLNADSARGISADILVFDEYQDISLNAYEVLEATLSHSTRKKIFFTGTSKTEDNKLEEAFGMSTQNVWTTDCPGCGKANVPDEKVLGPDSPICAECGERIDFSDGRWIPENPDAKWAAGFWINQISVGWMSWDDILMRQLSYDPGSFRNETLGLPFDLSLIAVTREAVELCCRSDPVPLTPATWRRLGIEPETISLGIDWGGGGADGVSRTALCVAGMTHGGVLHVLHLSKLPPGSLPEDAIPAALKLIHQVPYGILAGDAGAGGAGLNRLLARRSHGAVKRVYHIHYGSALSAIAEEKRGVFRWVVNRSKAIGDVMTRINESIITLPALAECGPLLEDIWTVKAEHDRHTRLIKYRRPAGKSDDCLHAIAYACAVSTRMWSKGHEYD